MATGDEAKLLQRLFGIFRVEAAEHLKAMTSLLLALEQPAAPEEAAVRVEALFREAHSLKGAARSVNLPDVEAACQELESALAPVKRGETSLTAPLLGSLHRGVDRLSRLLPEGAPVEPPAVPGAPLVPTSADTIRISTGRLSAVLVEAEELLAFKFGAGHLADELHALAADLAQWHRDAGPAAREARRLRRSRERHGAAMPGAQTVAALEKVLDAVERDELALKSVRERLARIGRLAKTERRTLSTAVDALQEDLRAALMVPFSSLLELLPKLARDLARDSGKEAEVRIEGSEIEIDRRILEQMKDPLIHLVRNAVDHGIEPPAARSLAGKPVRGRIEIAVTAKAGNRVELLVGDDGAGIALDKVRDAAFRLGRITAEEAKGMDEQATLGLLFESGLSTAPSPTAISGRGLGLAIVREKVEKLSGSVAVEPPPAGGTLFRILLPTTLATFRGLLVAAGRQQFVLPARSVARVLRVPADAVRTIENRESVEVGGQALALVWLADALGLAAERGKERYLQLAVLEGGGRRIAFAVDAVLGDQEVLVKGLGPQLRRVPNIAGATVLGSGRLVPILNVPDLLESALRAAPKPVAAAIAAPARPPLLLVVEDSVTARTLLKNILETAGFRVDTATDGIDALTALRGRQYDLVVSDVEMPRMDGFELTAKIRGDKKLADLPVVLVTALESREDKERGMEVGANAYIVKSSFDQSNLIEVIRRLT